jgi:hypothetical protein
LVIDLGKLSCVTDQREQGDQQDQLVALAGAAQAAAVESMEKRDDLIVAARDAGATLRKIATAVNLTDAAVLKIYRRRTAGESAQRRGNRVCH